MQIYVLNEGSTFIGEIKGIERNGNILVDTEKRMPICSFSDEREAIAVLVSIMNQLDMCNYRKEKCMFIDFNTLKRKIEEDKEKGKEGQDEET